MGKAKILIPKEKVANLIAESLDMQDFPQLQPSAVIRAEITKDHLVLIVTGPHLPEPESGIIKEEIYIE